MSSNYIKEKEWNEFDKLFNKLKKELGENDIDLKLLFLEANMKGLNAQNRKN